MLSRELLEQGIVLLDLLLLHRLHVGLISTILVLISLLLCFLLLLEQDLLAD